MDSKLKNHQGPLLASLERRLFLRRGLSWARCRCFPAAT
jgi:hypothetical protein